MNDKQIEAAIQKKGWLHVMGSIYQSPSKTLHDLSRAKPDKLDHIEQHRIFEI